MKRYNVDASTAVQWVAPEATSDRALALLAGSEIIHAPGHWLAEAANAVWAMHAVRRLLTLEQMTARIDELSNAPVVVTPVEHLVSSAGAIVAELRMSISDSLYLALAIRTSLPLVTADRRLVELASTGRYAGLAIWIGAVVERFLAWINRNRRLAKDFEATLQSAKAFLYAASTMLLLRRLAR